jgi:hypothetical protein
MSAFDPLVALLRSEAEIEAVAHGRTVVRAPTDVLAEVKIVPGHRELLRAIALGRSGTPRTGLFHALAPCTLCGEPSMVGVNRERLAGRAVWPRSRMTPKCERSDRSQTIVGRHVPVPDDIARAQQQMGVT